MKQRPAEVEEKVELTAEELAELDERADAVERGEFVDGDEVLRRLRSGYYATSLRIDPNRKTLPGVRPNGVASYTMPSIVNTKHKFTAPLVETAST
jgi:hypothetical protein